MFRGQSIGAEGTSIGEVVFNTAMTGYQEILTDPSYARQIITLTYPQIGNTGINLEDMESDRVWASGLVIRQTPRRASNWRMQLGLQEYLNQQGVVAIADVDTRRLTRLIREKGALAGCIAAGETAARDSAVEMALEEARRFPGLQGMDLAGVVTRSETTSWIRPAGLWERATVARSRSRYHVVAYDFGVKHNILRLLADRGCRLTVVASHYACGGSAGHEAGWRFPIERSRRSGALRLCHRSHKRSVAARYAHFRYLPGASAAVAGQRRENDEDVSRPPRGKPSGTGSSRPAVIITSQNHGFAVDADTLPNCLEVTHVSLFDGTLQGLRRTDRRALGSRDIRKRARGPRIASICSISSCN